MRNVIHDSYKLSSRLELLTTSERRKYIDSLLRSVMTIERKFRQALRRGPSYAERETQNGKLYLAWELLEQAGVMPRYADIENPHDISVYSVPGGAKISVPYTSRSKRKIMLEAMIHLDDMEIEIWGKI